MKSKTNVISVRELAAVYGKERVLRDVSFSVDQGEVFGLAGLNGAGKTTLIKVLLGLRDADKGEARIFGVSAGEQSVRRRLAYLPERFDPPWFLSGMDFLKFSVRLYNREWCENEALEAAEGFGLAPTVLKRRAHTYSKGMRQKLGLLSTMIAGCDLLLLDEPMSGLDPLSRVQVKKALLNLQKRGATIFFSSHVLSDMQEICSRLAVLDDGHIPYVGTPAQMVKKTAAKSLENAFLHCIEKRTVA